VSDPGLAVEQGKRAQNRTRRRAQVIEAASGLAADGGYDAVQMRDVADRAGVALGTLYRYFPSKDTLLVAALVESATELRERLSQKPPRGDTAADRIVDILRRASRYLERQPLLTAAMVAALSSPDPETIEVKHEAFTVLQDIISTALTGGDDDQRHAVVRALGNVWFAALIQWTVGMADATQMADDLETATRLLARGWNGD
jgi:AcrR family transcriptional regulator